MKRTSDKSELISRALAGWFRSGNTMQPSADSDVHEVAGLKYVVLRNVSGVIAVYRVLDTADRKQLKRLIRWPAELNGSDDPVATKLVSQIAKFDKTAALVNRHFGRPEGTNFNLVDLSEAVPARKE